jgi:uncharacterized protein
MHPSATPVVPQKRPPRFARSHDIRLDLGGVVGDRVRAAIDGWLVPAPLANPSMTEMLGDADSATSREMVPWAGEFVGKHLTAAIKVWRVRRDDDLQHMIESVIERVLCAQSADGYLGPFPPGVRLERNWDVWGHYHLMLGLLNWYEETGDKRLIDCCGRIGDLLYEFFVVGHRRMTTPEDVDGEKNYSIAHTLVYLYRLTGDERQMQLVDWIAEEWEVPPAGQYVSSALAGKPFWEFPAKRWESVHDVQAIGAIAVVTGDELYSKAFEHIWWSILEGDRHNGGGFTSSEACQGNPYDQGAIETCCTIAWIALSIDMLRFTGDSRVADEIELATLNGALGGQHPSGRWWTYDTPQDGVKNASAHAIVFQSRSGSPELNCCSVNGPRSIGMVSEWSLMLAQEGDEHDVAVLNYYGPGRLACTLPSGVALSLVQETEYPLEGETTVRVELEAAADFELRLRIPSWSAGTSVDVNGEAIADVEAGRYLSLQKTWRSGDTVRIAFDFSPHFWVGDRDVLGKASLYRGPVLLAHDPRYDTTDPEHLPTIDLANIVLERIEWDGDFQPPWLLVRAIAPDGSSIVLCDFANAGMTGRPYRSWLPATGAEPAGFSRDECIWSRRA